jgi:CBS domain-containing protein
MVPVDKVVTCKQTDTIKTVMDLMLEHNIGAVVVPNSPDHPIGIITKTDIVKAYHDNVTLDHKAQEIMQTGLEACNENMNRDQAAHILERNKVGSIGKDAVSFSS